MWHDVMMMAAGVFVFFLVVFLVLVALSLWVTRQEKKDNIKKAVERLERVQVEHYNQLEKVNVRTLSQGSDLERLKKAINMPNIAPNGALSGLMNRRGQF